MFRGWEQGGDARSARLRARRRVRLACECETLEPRCLLAATLSITPLTVSATEGLPATNLEVATFTDSDTTVTPADLTVTVNLGDGTTPVTVTPTQLAPGSFSVLVPSHTFAEESGSTVPPFAYTTTITVDDTKNEVTMTANGQADVSDAALAPGDPINLTAEHGTVTNGSGAGTATALANFVAAITGSPTNNSPNTTPAPQSGGFRKITWDGVMITATQTVNGVVLPNTVIDANTVGIPLNRFQNTGVFFGAVYAVNNNGFHDVNPNINLTPFSSPSSFAMFNDNGIDFDFVAASVPNTTPVSAATRGFGGVFLNVQNSDTTIQLFHGSTLLDTVTVPIGGANQPSFAGELFNDPIVTHVLLTLGNDVIFKYDGTTITAGGTDSATHNLVATDDWIFPEPVPIANGIPIVSGAQGTISPPAPLATSVGKALTNVVAATFNDADPTGNARDFTATINWGDGHTTNGTIQADGHGGFSVIGTNTYTSAGSFPINVDIQDFGGALLSVNNTAQVSLQSDSVTVAAAPGTALIGQPVVLTATVIPAAGAIGTPTGTVTFIDEATLTPVGLAPVIGGQATLTIPGLPPGGHSIRAQYSGDGSFASTSDTADAPVQVSPDITSVVTVSLSRARRRGRHNRVTATLVNHSQTTFPGPVELVFDNLRGATLNNAAGVTRVLPPLGSPFVVVVGPSGVFGGGSTVTVLLDFNARNARAVRFTSRVLAGLPAI